MASLLQPRSATTSPAESDETCELVSDADNLNDVPGDARVPGSPYLYDEFATDELVAELTVLNKRLREGPGGYYDLGKRVASAFHLCEGPGIGVDGKGPLPLPIDARSFAGRLDGSVGSPEWIVEPSGLQFENPAWRSGQVPARILEAMSRAFALPRGTTCVAELRGLFVAGPAGNPAHDFSARVEPGAWEGQARCAASAATTILVLVYSRRALRHARHHSSQQVGWRCAHSPLWVNVARVRMRRPTLLRRFSTIRGTFFGLRAQRHSSVFGAPRHPHIRTLSTVRIHGQRRAVLGCSNAVE